MACDMMSGTYKYTHMTFSTIRIFLMDPSIRRPSVSVGVAYGEAERMSRPHKHPRFERHGQSSPLLWRELLCAYIWGKS